MAIAISLLILILTIYLIHISIKLRPYNQGPLKIKTFDGTDCPYHPSVLYFKDSWNGYKYWMAETPFSPESKPYRDRNECPSIHVSNDGITWNEIIQDPIDNLTEKEIEELDYFSDPHLVFVNDRIECWYRFTHRNGNEGNFSNLQLIRKYSTDGQHWSEREVMVNLATDEGNSLGNMVVSPAILYQEGKYRMWYVNSELRTYRELSYSESLNGKEWTEQMICTFEREENTPWHIDVNFINGKYYLISYNFKDLTLWESMNGISFTYINKILEPSVMGSFYSEGLYRACILKDRKLKIYFSANDAFKTYIGLLENEKDDENNISFKFTTNKRHRNTVSLVRYVFAKKWLSAKFIAKRYSVLLSNKLNFKQRM